MPQKILFIKRGSFSLINDSILNILKNEFPDKEIEIIDVEGFWKHELKFYHYIINAWYFFIEYGQDFISGNKKRTKNNLLTWFLGTSYISLLTDKYIRKNRKDDQYAFTFQTQALFNGKIKGIPHFIYTDHTTRTNLLYGGINPREYMRSGRFIRRVEQAIYHDADTVFTCGSLISWSLLNQYHLSPEKVVTAYAGSNVPDSYIENNKKYESKNILFVGVDWQRKGGPVLIKAFEKVLKQHKDASLTIVGCSPKNITLPNCNIVGKIPASKVAAYYNEAAIFCLPTLREPFGIVFVEAMHYKLPVVANNTGSIPDMVINDFNGYLVDNDVDEYARRIEDLISNPTRCRQFGENGFTYANAKFTWELTGKTIHENTLKFLR